MCHIMTLHHLLTLKGILSALKNWLMLTERTSNVILSEFQQFHSYVCHEFSATNNGKTRFSHAELYKIIVEENIECGFPNVDISFHIFLTLMVTNCTAECSFSRLKYIKNSMRTTMQQGWLEALSLWSIEADILHKISFEDLIKDFAITKCRRKLLKYK